MRLSVQSALLESIEPSIRAVSLGFIHDDHTYLAFHVDGEIHIDQKKDCESICARVGADLPQVKVDCFVIKGDNGDLPNYDHRLTVFERRDESHGLRASLADLLDRLRRKVSKQHPGYKCPGYKELVDFGQEIGKYCARDRNHLVTTSKGVIVHGSRKRFWVIPARPEIEDETFFKEMVSDLLLSAQRALIGNVTSTMRGIAVDLTSQEMNVYIYYEGPLTDDLIDDMAAITGGMIADYHCDVSLNDHYVLHPIPKQLPHHNFWAYKRMES